MLKEVFFKLMAQIHSVGAWKVNMTYLTSVAQSLAEHCKI